MIEKYITLIYSSARNGEHPFISLIMNRAVGRKNVFHKYKFAAVSGIQNTEGIWGSTGGGKGRSELGVLALVLILDIGLPGALFHRETEKPRQIHPNFPWSSCVMFGLILNNQDDMNHICKSSNSCN